MSFGEAQIGNVQVHPATHASHGVTHLLDWLRSLCWLLRPLCLLRALRLLRLLRLLLPLQLLCLLCLLSLLGWLGCWLGG